ncbi:hypothetical protein SLEP1_g14799 [Rubroshorea leprosula]|nr:hypothetical protein SLEP1_g14799 [Rubroshorea leprosula]
MQSSYLMAIASIARDSGVKGRLTASFGSDLNTGENLILQLWMALLLTPPAIFSLAKLSSKSSRMALNRTSSNPPNFTTDGKRKLPILLFDIMDTVVRDPFYQDVPAFFG